MQSEALINDAAEHQRENREILRKAEPADLWRLRKMREFMASNRDQLFVVKNFQRSPGENQLLRKSHRKRIRRRQIDFKHC